MKINFSITHSLELVLIDVIYDLIELVQEVLPHPIPDLLTVLHLLDLSSHLHLPILPGRLLEECPLLVIIHQLEVALVVVLDLAFACQGVELLLHVICDIDLVLDSGPLFLDLLQLSQLLVDLLLPLELLLLLEQDLLF